MVQQGAVRSGGTVWLAHDASVLGNAAGVLATLALDGPSRPRMLHDGAARALVALCGGSRTADPRTLGNAAEGLAHLALEAETKTRQRWRGLVWWCRSAGKAVGETRDNRVAGYGEGTGNTGQQRGAARKLYRGWTQAAGQRVQWLAK